jgi:flagellar hook-associated protein 2
LSGLSSATTSTGASSASSTALPGNNTAPISFPGIASGIDYNSIIQKLTSLTLLPAQQAQTQITSLNAKNSEMIKVSSYLSSVQNTLSALSDPATFEAFAATSSNSSVLTGTTDTNSAGAAGTYIIDGTQLATATAVTGAVSSAVGHSLADVVPGTGGKTGDQVPLVASFTAIGPTNGSGTTQGTITVDGVQVAYNVSSQSLQTILSNITAAVASVDPGFSASFNAATDVVTFASIDAPISVGSQSDTGNLAQVLKLDVAQVTNTPVSGTVTSAGPIGGLSLSADFSSTNGANLITPVSGGSGSFFTINGVKITIDPTSQNLQDVIKAINQSSAGVVASYNGITNQVTLTNTATGPQSIVIGSASDTSNFLKAVGLEGAGATTTIGQQAYVKVQQPNGTDQTYYSSSDNIANAVPGITLTISGNSPTGTQTTLTVSQDPQPALNAINAFVSAYNAAINEINTASAPPVVQQTSVNTTSSAVTATSSKLASGGPLYNDLVVEEMKNQLISLVSNIVPTGSSSYNSLSSIGLSLDSTHSVLAASGSTNSATSSSDSSDTSSSGPIALQTQDGTSGSLQALDVAKFTAAFAANPTAVSALFNSAGGLVYQLGSYLTSTTGLPTQSTTGLIGSIPPISLIQTDENQVSTQITSLQDYITTIDNEANMQADLLRAQYTASETLIAGYQSLQTYVSQLS